MTHDLKIWPEFFQPVVTGVKTFEVRRDDRTYAQGDTLRLREFEPTQGYTGREVSRAVTYVLRDYSAGLRDGFVCLALGEPGPIGQCSFRGHAWDGNTVVKAKACKCGALTVMPTAEATALKVAAHIAEANAGSGQEPAAQPSCAYAAAIRHRPVYEPWTPGMVPVPKSASCVIGECAHCRHTFGSWTCGCSCHSQEAQQP